MNFLAIATYTQSDVNLIVFVALIAIALAAAISGIICHAAGIKEGLARGWKRHARIAARHLQGVAYGTINGRN